MALFCTPSIAANLVYDGMRFSTTHGMGIAAMSLSLMYSTTVYFCKFSFFFLPADFRERTGSQASLSIPSALFVENV